MPPYYFDIETTGLNPERDEIISIQYQKIVLHSGKAIGPLEIFTTWSHEFSEKNILKKILPLITSPNPFRFVPVGNNLNFEFKFLVNKINKYFDLDINLDYFISRPHMDIKPIMVFVNHGRFKGCHLVLNKFNNGSMVPQWYYNSQYEKIVDYIKHKAVSFTEFISNFLNLMYNNNKRIDDYV